MGAEWDQLEQEWDQLGLGLLERVLSGQPLLLRLLEDRLEGEEEVAERVLSQLQR